MKIPKRGELQPWLSRLLPAIVGFIAAGVVSPWAALGSAAVAAIAGLILRNPFPAIGLAAAMTPFGAWLVDHPGPVRLLLCATVCAAMVWWYRREILEGWSE
ncbi:MAG: hypothetical protein R2729_21275 [Bryobacteraceae bacterium]